MGKRFEAYGLDTWKGRPGSSQFWRIILVTDELEAEAEMP